MTVKDTTFLFVFMEYAELVDDLNEETSLSEKEAHVAILRAQGQTYREIADELGISPQATHAYARRATVKYERAERTIAELERIGFID